ncbi:unknown protein [Leptolyngbya sp. NIES-3755]|nr:unknown protein [Leptolyngbya sp. NIES-3755]
MSSFDEMMRSSIDLSEIDQKFTQAKQLQNALRQQRKDGRLLYEQWRNTADWKQWRAKQLERQNWRCNCCNQLMELGQTVYLANGDFLLQPNHPTVDHVLPKSLFPKLALDKQNLIMLCWTCNAKKGNRVAIASRMRHEQLKQSFEGWNKSRN